MTLARACRQRMASPCRQCRRFERRIVQYTSDCIPKATSYADLSCIARSKTSTSVSKHSIPPGGGFASAAHPTEGCSLSAVELVLAFKFYDQRRGTMQ